MTGDGDLSCRRRGTGCNLLRRRWNGSGLVGTPLLHWKFHGENRGGRRRGLSGAGGGAVAVSVRKLAASLWQLDAIADNNGGLGWQYGSFAPLRLEEGTKRHSDSLKASSDANRIRSHVKLLENQKIANISVPSATQAELFKARDYIKELEAERSLLRSKLKCYAKKLNEEKASWMRREHKKMFVILKDLKDDMKRERSKCEKMEFENSDLRSYVADSKFFNRRFMQNYEKEKQARELLEDTCYQLANKIEENKAEMGELLNECARFREEIEEKRKMLQTAEIWREERAQMKLVDAKLILEDKYFQMNNLVANLEAFFRSSNVTADTVDMSNAKVFKQASDFINIQEIKEFSHVPQNSNDTLTISQNSQINEAGTNADHCICHDQALNASSIRHVNLEANDSTRNISLSNSFTGDNSGFEDASAKETVTQAEMCSIHTLGGSEGSVNKIIRNKHNSSCQQERDNKSHHKYKKSDSSESSSISSKQSKKKGSSVCKIRRTLTGNKDHMCNTISIDSTNRRVSNESIPSSIVSQASPERASDKEAIGSHSFVNQWSTEPRNPHIVRAMKGGIKWPKGIQRNVLKAKLENQKMQLLHVLKQRT